MPVPKLSRYNWEFLNSPEAQAMAIKNELIGVIDAGTSSITFAIYTTPDFTELCSHRVEIEMISPQDGWFEQSPMEMIDAVRSSAKYACEKLLQLDNDYKISDIVAIGISNQRETTIAWDKYTGEPLYNAIGWNDIRTDLLVDQMLARIPEKNKNYFKSISGLPICTYFSAIKIRWLKENVTAVKKACREKRCLVGTVDSWILWNLTGGPKVGLHITDVTNASRTMLMNIDTLNWDPVLLKAYSVHPKMLPEIRSSSEVYGTVKDNSVLNGIRVSGILGNQQAALMGQMCFKVGQAKSSYRAGCFLLCNTGENKIISEHGLITTVAYKLGKDKPPIYALEGAVAVAGAALTWLKNNLEILPNEKDAESLANVVHNTGDVYFVPAFTGLFTPYYRKDARGIICGLTQFTTKNHIIRAALEAICYRNRDILECMNQECGFKLRKLYTDGHYSTNNLLMQLQADLLGVPVFRAQLEDTTRFGIAMCAAQAEGVDAFELNTEKRYYENNLYDTFLPTTTEEERDARYTKWKKAVERSLGWIQSYRVKTMTEERYKIIASIPASLFLSFTFACLVHAHAKAKLL